MISKAYGEVFAMMQYLIDSANIDAIRHLITFYPIDGVTTNPTILSREKRDFLPLISEIRELIGEDRLLFVQTTADTADGILAEAALLKPVVGRGFVLKVPMTEAGLRAIPMLKNEGYTVAVTAVFSPTQALFAAKAGADYVAPFVNRLDNILADGTEVIAEIVELFRTHNCTTKVLAASFKTAEQIYRVSLAGADAATVSPDLYPKLISHPMTDLAIETFGKDWKSVYGDTRIPDLL